MEAKKPKGFGKFDQLMRKLVKVPAEAVMSNEQKRLTGLATADDCKPGLYVELTSGRVVGPIYRHPDFVSIFVECGPKQKGERHPPLWMLDVVGDPAAPGPPDPESPRLVRRVGTREELLAHQTKKT
jgi:hypothetical protein